MHYLMPAVYLGLGSLFKTRILFGFEAAEAAAEIRDAGLHKLTIRGFLVLRETAAGPWPMPRAFRISGSFHSLFLNNCMNPVYPKCPVWLCDFFFSVNNPISESFQALKMPGVRNFSCAGGGLKHSSEHNWTETVTALFTWSSLRSTFTKTSKGATRFPAKLICCHGEGFAEPAAPIMRYSEALASHLALALKARSFPGIKRPRAAPGGVLSVRSSST